MIKFFLVLLLTNMLIFQVVTFFHHVDPSHDLVLEFSVHGFRPSIVKFPRAETFSTMAKFSGTKFSQSETLAFDSDFCNGNLYALLTAFGNEIFELIFLLVTVLHFSRSNLYGCGKDNGCILWGTRTFHLCSLSVI